MKKEKLENEIRQKKIGIRKSFESQKKQIKREIGFDLKKCKLCQAEKDLCIDHIFPICKGGDNNLSNFQVLCRSCNSKKGGK